MGMLRLSPIISLKTLMNNGGINGHLARELFWDYSLGYNQP